MREALDSELTKREVRLLDQTRGAVGFPATVNPLGPLPSFLGFLSVMIGCSHVQSGSSKQSKKGRGKKRKAEAAVIDSAEEEERAEQPGGASDSGSPERRTSPRKRVSLKRVVRERRC